MFHKFASNILQDIADECMLKSFACKDDVQAELYRSVSSRLDWVVSKLAVEEGSEADQQENE